MHSAVWNFFYNLTSYFQLFTITTWLISAPNINQSTFGWNYMDPWCKCLSNNKIYKKNRNFFEIQICITHIKKTIMLKNFVSRNFFIKYMKVFYVKFFTWMKIQFSTEIMTNKKFSLWIIKFAFQRLKKIIILKKIFLFTGVFLVFHMSHASYVACVICRICQISHLSNECHIFNLFYLSNENFSFYGSVFYGICHMLNASYVTSVKCYICKLF